MGPVRAIGDRARALVGMDAVDLTRPPGDDGLFGPGSATWAVHGDLVAMTVGGVASLLMQMLHPAALAGVWDHSGFRRDMAGRLKRTAQFTAVTTYGATAAAERAIAGVRAIHARVRGAMPDGTPYAADDPALLTWVHAAGVDGFLRAHLRVRDPLMPPARQDAYLAEMAEVARRLGAGDVPESRAALARYMREVRPALRADARTRETARRLLAMPPPNRWAAPAHRLLLTAGVDLLPRWAAGMHGLERSLPERAATRLGVLGIGGVLRRAMRQR